MAYKQGRYSIYIKPLFGFIDFGIIIFTFLFFNINVKNIPFFLTYALLSWVVISLSNHFYEIQRHTKMIHIATLLLKQIIFLSVLLYAFIGFFKQPNISRLALGNYIVTVSLLLILFKISSFFLLKRYRAVLGGNRRNVIVVGKNEKTRQLIEIFNKKSDFGYFFKAQFDVNDSGFSLEKCFDFIINNNIDEIYFSARELSNKQIIKLIDFADNNLRELKFIPDNKEIFSKKLKYEYYDYIPVLSLRNIPLEDHINFLFKRTFDILFSSNPNRLRESWSGRRFFEFLARRVRRSLAVLRQRHIAFRL